MWCFDLASLQWFYLDFELTYTWQEASLVVAKSRGSGIRIRTWIHKYLRPMHIYGRYHSSILEDEDFAQGIQLWLVEIAKDGYIKVSAQLNGGFEN